LKVVFWLSVGVIAYTFVGYWLWLYLRGRWFPRPVRTAAIFPKVSIVMAVRNEAKFLPNKLSNLFGLKYPADHQEIIVVSDGSTDATNQILLAQTNDSLRVIVLDRSGGKACALNQAIQAARGEIVVFTDVRQSLEPEALCRLVENFADPEVGGVSGELMLGCPEDPKALRGAGLYWMYEKKVRQWEGLTGSVIGATGALYAVRRELLRELPAGTILDDVYLPMQVVRQGQRVVFEQGAQAWDIPPSGVRVEFRRKVRTLTGNYQLLQLAPWLLTRENPMRFEFVSHKMFRLLVPFALVGALVSSLVLGGGFYRAVATLQILFYASAVFALVPARLGGLGRLANVTLTFIVLNTAAVVALGNFLTRKKEVWAR
jgi:cellulose synthase/poly-beta-1,6-N-acetylglucosamine synthase-like glycosyltransferase